MMNLKCMFGLAKKGILFAFLFVYSLHIFAQQNKTIVWVYFKDKAGVEFNPYTYFDANTIERRNNANISLVDSTDFDLNQNYVNQIASFGDSITIKSRWFNAVKLWGCNAQDIKRISSLKFVKNVEVRNTSIEQNTLQLTTEDTTETVAINEKLLAIQNQHLGGSYFEKNEIDGKGIKVAVFDAGFPSFDKNPYLKIFLTENRLYKTYNFLKKDINVFKGNSHGTMTASCIAGVSGSRKLGLATAISLLLAITEYGMREPAIEEDYWLAAAEWADKNGADIISSSLGYGNNRYTFKDMDGRTSLVSKAARMAVRKGILVVNSAGNEYTNSWKFIITPGDVDSVLTVGGIDPETGYHISYSSMGPTSNNLLKPNVCAIGHVIAAKGLGAKEVDGTSFSCPLIAGFAACVLQANKQWKGKPMQLFKAIESSATLYPYFDYMHGYGVPQAKYFFEKNEPLNPTFEINKKEETIVVNIMDNIAFSKIKSEDEQDVLYYNIQNESGIVIEYFVIGVTQAEVLRLPVIDFKKGQKLNVSYHGYTTFYQF